MVDTLDTKEIELKDTSLLKNQEENYDADIDISLSDSGHAENGTIIQVVEPPRSPFQRIIGISLVFLASLLFSVNTAMAKYLKNVPPGQFLLVRGGYGVLCLIPMSLYKGIPLFPPTHRKLFVFRCVIHGTAYCLKIWCVKNMNIGDAVALYFTGPIFAGLFARIFLKEKYTVVNIFCTIIGFTGVVLIAKPSFIFHTVGLELSYNPWYALIVVCGACMLGMGYTSQRALGRAKAAHPITVSLYMNVWVSIGGCIVNGVTSQSFVLPTCYTERLILSGCGIGACIGLIMLNKGLGMENSAPATLMRNMDIVLAFLTQVLLFKEAADWMSILGAVFIVSGAVSVTLERALCPNWFWEL